MWIRKLSSGVLRVSTPLGPRYIQPSFEQRIYLLWIFRHFEILPLQVLSRRERDFIESLCAQPRFISIPASISGNDLPVLGTIERRPPVEMEPPARRPSTSVTEGEARAAGGIQQGS
jgi:hypothetical protein